MTHIPARVRSASALASLALALSLGLAACGGDDDGDKDASGGSDETAEPSEPNGGDTGISKDDFVLQANAICTAGNAELASAAETLDPSDPAALAAYATDVLVPNIGAQLSEIRDLGFPEGDEEVLGDALEDASAALSAIVDDPTLLASGAGPFAEVNETLTGYGLTECGSA